IDLLPRFPQETDASSANRSGGVRPAVYQPIGGKSTQVTATGEGAEPSAVGDGYDLNFENAPVTTVAKVILGDILGAGYIIDPRVQGTVTLTSGRPVPKDDIVYVLENALRVSNVALIRDTNGYRLVPSNEAVAGGRTDMVTADGRPQPGYGISVIPVRYVSAQTLVKLLDNFATKQGALRVDVARNMLLIQGSGAERRTAVETVLSFDTDWMRHQTVGIFPVRHSTPEALIAEIDKIMDAGEGGLSQSLVKMQPIARMNAILVAASKPALLKTAETWIRRLDNSEISSTGVKVYRVKYGEARNVAAILNEMFGLGGPASSTSIESTTNQIAPGGGLTTLSSGGLAGGGSSSMSPAERLTGGPPPGRTLTVDTPAAAALGARGQNAARNAGGALLTNVRITADVTNNSLLIYANEESYRVIQGALRQIDRPQMQVAFDATIAEVTL